MTGTCIVCNVTYERLSKWGQRQTCGSHACRTKLFRVTGKREPSPAPDNDAPSPRQVHFARHSATEAELRLMAPAIRAAARA